MKLFFKLLAILGSIVLILAGGLGCVKKPEKTSPRISGSSVKTIIASSKPSGTASRSTARDNTISMGDVSEENVQNGADEPKDLPSEEDQNFFNSPDSPFAGLKFNTSGMDLGGRTMYISGSPPEKSNGILKDEVWWARKEKAERIFNVRLEHREPDAGSNWANYDAELMNNFLSGTRFVDKMFILSRWAVPKYIKIGLAQPVDDVIDFNHPAWRRSASSYRYINGLHYGINNDRMLAMNPWMTVYNKNILEK
ncbi:MAG TPA: hypothetical protein DCY35_06115, partial [Prolixibacteraceae bacterium]|nr:hypothetical protein [Prolixibacteraceae bacterium]